MRQEDLMRATGIVLLRHVSAQPPTDRRLYTTRGQMSGVFKLADGCAVHWFIQDQAKKATNMKAGSKYPAFRLLRKLRSPTEK